MYALKMNALPLKIINYYTPDLCNKTQGSTGGKVTDLENLVTICDISNKCVKANLFLQRIDFFFYLI